MDYFQALVRKTALILPLLQTVTMMLGLAVLLVLSAPAQAAPAPEEAPLATEQEESSGGGEEPSLREFTLLVSKLLFHLSQM